MMHFVPRQWLVRTTVFAALVLGCAAAPLLARPTDQDVIKSIQDSMSQPTRLDPKPLLLLGAGGVAALLVVAVSHLRQKRAASPKPLNHPGRLLKEVLRSVPLKSAEVKQLKVLAESVSARSGQEVDALALLLCPSLIARGLKESPLKIDRKVVVGLVGKLRAAGHAKAP